MSTSIAPQGPTAGRTAVRAAQIIVVSSVMFSFISFWRTAAVVLCDMSSTVFYIGAIVENAIGKAAPWFILAVLLFSYAMRAVYIESCGLFVRGGVYRVVKEALGGFMAKLSVSALLFDYVLTGPISGVSAGQYIVGLALETIASMSGWELDEATRQAIKSWGSVAIACGITLYFLRQNLLGIPHSSGKALKIMIATTVMGFIMLAWSGATLAIHGPVNDLSTWQPDLHKKVELNSTGDAIPKVDPVTGEQQDPLGAVGQASTIAEPIRNPASWLSLVGLVGLIIAFGHSILAMSGEETLAQVYREVEAPKLKNFKKAAFVVFAYSLLLTGTMNFLAVLLVPDELRMTQYYDNWMGGLAMQMVGPVTIRLLLNAFVVLIGFLILSGAVNTSIIGSNGVLSRVAEDGVLPDWFLRPHARFGTAYRQLYVITSLQLLTIIASRGDVILLGEAYAFGVVWSFVFKTMSMVVLRFTDKSPREFRVPFNIRVGTLEVPVGLGGVFLVVLLAAIANLFTKPVATVSGLAFTAVFLVIFLASERIYQRRRKNKHHEHREQFNRALASEITGASLGLTKPHCKLVAIRSPHNLFMLEKALRDTDPMTTDAVVMTAKVEPPGALGSTAIDLDRYDERLMTAVVTHAERLGKPVQPLVVPTNNALHAILKVAKSLAAQEVVLGASNKYTVEEQLDQIAFYWISLFDGNSPGLTVQIVSENRELVFDLHGGNRIPKAAERQAHSVADLRASGIGVRRVLLAHDGSRASRDVFEWLVTMLATDVDFDIAPVQSADDAIASAETLEVDRQWAVRLGRTINVCSAQPPSGPELVQFIRQGNYDAVVLPAAETGNQLSTERAAGWAAYTLEHAPCSVFVAAHPAIPREIVA
jgi:amino acid transporter